MDVRVHVMHNLNVNSLLITLLICLVSINAFSVSETETKKTYLEDIFIWKISDELKLSAKEEKNFTEINKNLNKKKAELNKKIQDLSQELYQVVDPTKSSAQLKLGELRKLVLEYGQLSVREFDQVKKLLGSKKFVKYLQIKSELTNKVKSLIAGDKTSDKASEKENTDLKEVTNTPLPPPQVIIEKNE